MAIVYADINNDFSPIYYNGSILPYGITCPALHFTDDDAVSPPCSPREDGEQEVRPRIIFHEGYWRRLVLIPYTEKAEMKKRQHKFSKNPHKKNMTKYHRRMGKLKQPGGASCNQRR